MNGDKLKKVYNLPKNLYIAGSPIIIKDGGLYKDEAGEKVFLSLNFKDAKAKEVANFKVKVHAFDTIWKPLGQALEFSFDDPEGENLLQLTQFDKSLYAINAVVSQVTFQDGLSWENSEDQWISLEDADLAEGKYFDPAILDERKRQFAEKMNKI